MTKHKKIVILACVFVLTILVVACSIIYFYRSDEPTQAPEAAQEYVPTTIEYVNENVTLPETQ